MTLIRFFYGNGVPLELAIQLFQACNDRVDFYMTELFFCYATWQNWKDATHIAIYEYYDIKIKRHVYINGSRKTNS